MCCNHYHWRGWASSLITSFSLSLSLTKIACISCGKGFLIHHICSWFGPIHDLLYLEVPNLLWSIFPRYLQKNSPSCYVLLITKAKEIKYQQLCFHTDICCNISQTELHIFFFAYCSYDIQILPVLLKGHQIYLSHFQMLQTFFGIWNWPGVF